MDLYRRNGQAWVGTQNCFRCDVRAVSMRVQSAFNAIIERSLKDIRRFPGAIVHLPNYCFFPDAAVKPRSDFKVTLTGPKKGHTNGVRQGGGFVHARAFCSAKNIFCIAKKTLFAYKWGSAGGSASKTYRKWGSAGGVALQKTTFCIAKKHFLHCKKTGSTLHKPNKRC